MCKKCWNAQAEFAVPKKWTLAVMKALFLAQLVDQNIVRLVRICNYCK